MKSVAILCLLAVAAGGASKETPIDKVVVLIKGLASEIEKDGKAEQASYDAYACWVEKTLQRKASDISEAKELIGELNDLIKKLGAEIASHGAEIAQLTKDIAQNKQATKEATGIRNKENAEYAQERSESEQCLGALEAAVSVLTGAGTKKAGFMQDQQFHEAQLMSVAMGVRRAMQTAHAHSKMSEADANVVMRFVSKPEEFTSKGMVAAQTGQNPFGDYAPQSSQIQGILKGMYDGMAADLEKDNVKEANSQKSFEELHGTKMQELATLTATLQIQETSSAAKTKKLAEANVQRDDTTDQLAADEKFFADTKEAAQNKATEWSVRTRMRTEELAGIEGAIQILAGGSKTFQEATSNKANGELQLVELKSVHRHSRSHNAAYDKLRILAATSQSANLKRVVALLKSGGHFDKVMIMIDSMMALLRKEEQEDIEHRDRCENGQNANSNQMEDLNAAIKKTDQKLKRMGRTDDALVKDLDNVKAEIKATKSDMKEMLDLRNEDHNDFTRALKMDAEAIDLIGMAMARLTEYYKKNNIPLGLVQAPEYTKDADKAPETSFSGGDAHQGESSGIVAILSMIKEDLQKEMKEGRADEAEAQAEYEKQSGALQDSLDAQMESKANLEKERSSLQENMSSAEKSKKEKQDDLGSEKDMKKALGTDCEWVKTHFKSRREKRKTEMDGLVEAKSFLAGVENGDAVLAPEIAR